VREPGDLDPSKAPTGDWVRRREGPSGKLVALGIVVVLLLIFVIQNTDKSEVDLFLWDANVPIWLVIVIAAALGFVGGWVVALLRRRRKSRPAAPPTGRTTD
jgi:uncharacterized integral membrane protein